MYLETWGSFFDSTPQRTYSNMLVLGVVLVRWGGHVLRAEQRKVDQTTSNEINGDMGRNRAVGEEILL